jgi:methylmalonyl-CoA/ethylmalonyl-CoA epimerase
LSPELDATCQRLRQDQMLVVQRPTQAVAFPGRRIAWLLGEDRTLVELLEPSPGGGL